MIRDLRVEFPIALVPSDIPAVPQPIRYTHERVVVVAGVEGESRVAYPAAAG